MKKKLSKAAMKKESTGINIEAAKKREQKIIRRLEELESAFNELAEVVGHKTGEWCDFEIKKEVEKLMLSESRRSFENELEKEQLKKIMKYFQDYFTGRRK
jgi:sugar-specific transcriptional regulator TrmB